MSKAIKFRNNIYLDSSSIVYNRLPLNNLIGMHFYASIIGYDLYNYANFFGSNYNRFCTYSR